MFHYENAVNGKRICATKSLAICIPVLISNKFSSITSESDEVFFFLQPINSTPTKSFPEENANMQVLLIFADQIRDAIDKLKKKKKSDHP